MNELPSDARPYFEQVLCMLSAGNVFMKTLYNASLRLLPQERDVAIESGMTVLSIFKRCAAGAFKDGKTRWKMRPKLHMIAEILYNMRKEAREDLPSINPLSTSTQLDEDYVGRVCGLSRTVSGKKIHLRTLR